MAGGAASLGPPSPDAPPASQTPAQVENMTSKWHVFMTKDGRISLAGLNSARAGYLAEAVVDSVRNF